MLFFERKTALVRLSDCIKIGLQECNLEAKHLLALHLKHVGPLSEIRRIARMALSEQIPYEKAEEEMKRVNQAIPENEAIEAIVSQGALHAKSLSVVLNCCFCMESYINSLAFHLFQEKDFLGLIRDGHDVTAEILLDAIDKMSTQSKWETIGKLKTGSSFDKSKSPFQDFKALFNFRNDVVHDKTVDYKEDRPRQRYSGKLPDPVFGFLDLSHGILRSQYILEYG